MHSSADVSIRMCSFYSEGLRIPSNEWAKIMTEQIQKVQNLERQYHDDLTYMKVRTKILPMQLVAL